MFDDKGCPVMVTVNDVCICHLSAMMSMNGTILLIDNHISIGAYFCGKRNRIQVRKEPVVLACCDVKSEIHVG